MKKIVLSHPTGNANVRATADALCEAGLLESFHTSIAVFKNTLFYELCKGPFKKLRARSCNRQLLSYTKMHPFKEILRQLSLFEVNVDDVYQDLDKKIVKYITKYNKKIDAVYAYDDGAYLQFQKAKQYGIKCIFELPIIHWRAYLSLLEHEKNINPQWAATLQGTFINLEKLKRKDTELMLADYIVVASSYTKETIEEFFPYKHAPIYVIPYGFPNIFPNRVYNETKNRKLKFLYVGRLTQAKGIGYLLEAIDCFRDEIDLTLVGNGNYIKNCPKLEYELHKYNHINYLAHEDVLKIMSESDVLIFPSLFEGFGLVIAEAMSQGTPVLTTKQTCGRDFIIDGENGWLVNSGSTEELKEKIVYILRHKDQLSNVGRSAMETASKRPWGVYKKELIELMEKII